MVKNSSPAYLRAGYESVQRHLFLVEHLGQRSAVLGLKQGWSVLLTCNMISLQILQSDSPDSTCPHPPHTYIHTQGKSNSKCRPLRTATSQACTLWLYLWPCPTLDPWVFPHEGHFTPVMQETWVLANIYVFFIIFYFIFLSNDTSKIRKSKHSHTQNIVVLWNNHRAL